MTTAAGRMAHDQPLEARDDVRRAVLPTVFNIFRDWQLSGEQQMTLLGLSNEKTLYNWKRAPGNARLTRDLLERASYILGIYRALQILLPEPALADRWLRSPNDTPFFGGRPPLERLLGGLVADLAAVRAFLDAERGR